MSLITCKDVGFCYEGSLAVSGINCTIERGDYLCVVGENGSGKTTLIKGILGLLTPSEGKISFEEGFKPYDIGYLPQQSAIQRNFPASVFEVVLSGCLSRHGLSPLYTKSDRNAARQMLDLLDIGALEKTGYSELSGGQQQRVLLARALCSAPNGLKVLILDEPMNGLDPHIKHELYETLDTLNKESLLAIVMVTHDIQTAVKHASHLLALDKSQEFFGTAHEFQHTQVGQELMRDSCGGNCAVCGIPLGGEQ
jgi:zinc transport system ATP-binding protein